MPTSGGDLDDVEVPHGGKLVEVRAEPDIALLVGLAGGRAGLGFAEEEDGFALAGKGGVEPPRGDGVGRREALEFGLLVRVGIARSETVGDEFEPVAGGDDVTLTELAPAVRPEGDGGGVDATLGGAGDEVVLAGGDGDEFVAAEEGAVDGGELVDVDAGGGRGGPVPGRGDARRGSGGMGGALGGEDVEAAGAGEGVYFVLCGDDLLDVHAGQRPRRPSTFWIVAGSPLIYVTPCVDGDGVGGMQSEVAQCLILEDGDGPRFLDLVLVRIRRGDAVAGGCAA
jgi:hypothetical protein